jgi:hypothetical protein
MNHVIVVRLRRFVLYEEVDRNPRTSLQVHCHDLKIEALFSSPLVIHVSKNVACRRQV